MQLSLLCCKASGLSGYNSNTQEHVEWRFSIHGVVSMSSPKGQIPKSERPEGCTGVIGLDRLDPWHLEYLQPWRSEAIPLSGCLPVLSSPWAPVPLIPPQPGHCLHFHRSTNASKAHGSPLPLFWSLEHREPRKKTEISYRDSPFWLFLLVWAPSLPCPETHSHAQKPPLSSLYLLLEQAHFMSSMLLLPGPCVHMQAGGHIFMCIQAPGLSLQRWRDPLQVWGWHFLRGHTAFSCGLLKQPRSISPKFESLGWPVRNGNRLPSCRWSREAQDCRVQGQR